MTSDFNIKNSNWNPSYPHYSIHSNIIYEVVNSLNLNLSISINLVPT